MKTKFLSILVLLTASLSLSACDPGAMEYGYYYNPKSVMYKVFTSLKNNDYNDDWIILFHGKMTCYYNSEEGIAKLKNTIGDMNTALDRFRLEQPRLVRGTEKSGEYKARVIRNSDNKVIFTATIGCSDNFCSITDLKNHLLGNPNVPVCEDLK